MEATGSKAFATFAKGGSVIFKVAGVLLLIYVAGTGIYAYSQFSSMKSKLLTYGLTDATGNLVAYAVMLVALALPALALVRFFIGTPKTTDWLAAMALPLISWGAAQLPANFDATTGESLKYCARRPSGELFCLDRPGVDPLTQKKLNKMDATLAELDIRKREGRIPKRIETAAGKIQYFDSLSDPSHPEPKVWVVPDGKDCFALFDNPGVDPTTGDQLQPVTKAIVKQIMKCLPAASAVISTPASADRPVAVSGQAPPQGSAAAPTVSVVVSQPNAAVNAAAEQERARRELAAEQERTRRELAVEAKVKYQSELAELSRSRDRDSRTVESEYHDATSAAQNSRAAALVELERKHQQDLSNVKVRCDLQNKALAKIAALSGIGQGACQQAQNDTEARNRQGALDIESSYQTTLKVAQDVRTQRMAEGKERFERSRMELTQSTQTSSR